MHKDELAQLLVRAEDIAGDIVPEGGNDASNNSGKIRLWA